MAPRSRRSPACVIATEPCASTASTIRCERRAKRSGGRSPREAPRWKPASVSRSASTASSTASPEPTFASAFLSARRATSRGSRAATAVPGVKTVLPAVASAWLDFRLVPDQRPDQVLALLQSHLERHGFDDLEVTVLGAAEPAGTAIDDPFVQRVTRIAAEITGKPPSINPRIGGTLPIIASLQRHLDVPGVAAPDNPSYWGSRPHAPNEHIRLEDLGHAIRFTHALFLDLATGT